MKLLKNIKGSQLVEKIMMTAFSVAAGAGVVVYGANVITISKNTNVVIDGVTIAEKSNGVQLITGHKYKINNPSELNSSIIRDMTKNDFEYVSCSKVFDENGNERKGTYRNTVSYSGFIGYSCWDTDDGETFYLAEKNEVDPFLAFVYDKATYERYLAQPESWCNDNYPRLHNSGCDDGWNENWTFVFSGTYARQGNGPHLIDYLVEVQE